MAYRGTTFFAQQAKVLVDGRVFQGCGFGNLRDRRLSGLDKPLVDAVARGDRGIGSLIALDAAWRHRAEGGSGDGR